VAKYDEIKDKYESIKKENNELQEKLESQQLDFANKNALNEKNLEEYRENLIKLSDTQMELDQSKKDIESLKGALVKSKDKMTLLQENNDILQN